MTEERRKENVGARLRVKEWCFEQQYVFEGSSVAGDRTGAVYGVQAVRQAPRPGRCVLFAVHGRRQERQGQERHRAGAQPHRHSV
ncbi:hypothetical protein EMIT0158MI4_130110 [Burkholderia ambifaria]